MCWNISKYVIQIVGHCTVSHECARDGIITSEWQHIWLLVHILWSTDSGLSYVSSCQLTSGATPSDLCAVQCRLLSSSYSSTLLSSNQLHQLICAFRSQAAPPALPTADAQSGTLLLCISVAVSVAAAAAAAAVALALAVAVTVAMTVAVAVANFNLIFTLVHS